jgi:hypothetical protein
MRLTRLLTLIVLACSVRAMADEPTATAPAATTVTAPDPAAAEAAAKADARDKKMRSRGYKPGGERGGQTLYCRSEIPVGSRLPNKVCLTADQIDGGTDAGKDYIKDLQQRGNQGTPTKQ